MNYEVSVTREIQRPAKDAYHAFADGPSWSKWFSKNTQVDLRKGGRFSNDDGDRGEYLEIEQNELLRFTWEGSFKGSQIEIHFKATDPQNCEVTLRHYLLAAQADANRMQTCWSWTLDNLASFLEHDKIIPMSEWKAKKESQGRIQAMK